MGGSPFQERLRSPAGMAAVLAVVVLFSALLYLPATSYSFVWDDNTLITGNSLLSRSRPAELFTRGFWAGSPDTVAGPAAAYYRPLATLSFWVDLHLSDGSASWFHLVNLLLYSAAAAAVTLVLWELLHSGVWALLGGLLFAAHPSHVESVAFVSGRTDVLLTLFTCLAAVALLRSFRKRNRWWWLAVPPAFGLALLSKETAVLFPLLVVLAPLLVRVRYDRWYWLLVLANLAVLGVYLLLRAAAVPVPIPVATGAGLWGRLAAVANTLGLYVQMFFWPFDHHAKFPATDAFLVPTPKTLAALLFIVSVPLLALRRRFAATLWGYTWTIAFLLPVANITSIGPLAAERLLCLPSAGIVMVLVTAFSRLLTFRRVTRQLVGTGLAVVILLLGVDTVRRAGIWRNNETLFTAMVREAPDAPSAYANLADAIGGRRPDSAIALYNRALRLDQGYVHAHLHTAMLLSQKGDHRRALHHLRLANELQPNSGRVLNNLGLAFAAAGETDSALAAFDRALAAQPGSALLYLNRASTLISAGRFEAADADLYRAISLDSTMAAARVMLADRLEQHGRFDSAIVLMQKVTGTHPTAVHLNRLGSLFIRVGDSAQAGVCYRRALRADSAYVPALFNLSVLLSADGESAAARVLAERAYRLRPDLEAVRELRDHLSAGSSPRAPGR